MANDQTIVTTIEADSAGADEGFASAEAAAASLGEALSALAASAEEMSASIEASVSAMVAAVDDATGSVSALGASMDAAGGSADTTAGSMGGLAGSADAASASVSAEGDAAAGAAEKNAAAATSTDGLGASFKKLKMPLLVAGAAVVGIGIAAVHMAGDFQDSMTQLVTGAGESKSNLAQVSAGVLSISAQVGISAKNTAAGMYLIESAGYHGAAGLAVLKASEEGAKVGGAQMATVADATTTILNDFGSKGETAANAVNALIATVAQGKTHLQDLGQSLSQILPTASAANVGLNDVMGAMATMTSEGVPAANAATYLRQTILALDAPSTAAKKALASVGLSSKDVAAEMQKSLPDALAMITDAVGKKFPVGSAAYVQALKDISGGSKTMQGMLDLTGSHLATFRTDVGNVASAVKKGGNSIIGWSDVQKDFNTKLAQTGVAAQNMLIALGQQIMPIAQAVMSHLLPAITGITAWIEGHGKQAAQIFGILAAAIGGALVTALVGAAVAAGPIVLIAAGIAAAVGALSAGIMLLVTHWKQVTQALAPVTNALRMLWSFIQPLAVALKDQLGAVVAQLGETFRTQLLPAWKQLQTAFDQAKPMLIALAAVIGAIVVVQLGLLIGVLKGTLAMIGPLASGLIRILGGAFQVVAGVIRLVVGVVSGVAQLIVDLVTGKWSKLGGDVLRIWTAVKDGVGQILAGLGNMVAGFFGGLLGAVGGFLSGFVSGVLGFFQTLWEKLVGHSIIPDMISQIVSTFASLPGKVLGLVAGLVSGVVSHMAQMATGVLSHVARMVPGVGGLLDQMQRHASDKTAIMRDETAMHADEMKERTLAATAATQMQAAQHFDQMRQKLVQEIAQTSDPVKKHALEMQLAVVTNAEKMHVDAAKAAEAMAQEVAEHARKMAADAKAHAADMHQGVLGEAAQMVSSVVSKAAALPGQVIGAVVSLDAKLVGFFSGLATKALSWGANIISSLASGITSKLGAVTSAVGNVAGKIKGFLGFGSPTEEGPGSTADQWMPHLVTMLAGGLTAGAAQLRAAATTAAGGIAAGLTGNAAGGLALPAGAGVGAGGVMAAVASTTVGAAASSSGAGAGAMTHNDAATLAAKLDTANGYLARIAQAATSAGSGAGNAPGGPRPMLPAISISGGNQGIQQIAAQLNQLGGYAAEYANRGAIAGVAYNG